jgi:hypothetical protein
LKKRTLSIIVLSFLFWSLFPSHSKATLLENIPLDSWVYSVVEELYTQGLFPELHKDVKPYTRGEIASLVLKINLKQRDGWLNLTDSQLWLISKLNQDLKYELEELYYADQTDQNKTNVIKYGTSPVVSLNLAEGDSSYGRLQARFNLGIEFNKKVVLYDRVVIDNQAQKERNQGVETPFSRDFRRSICQLGLEIFRSASGKRPYPMGSRKQRRAFAFRADSSFQYDKSGR